MPEKNVDLANPPEGNVLYLMDKPGAVQSVLFAGSLMPPRRDALDLSLGLANDVFGGTPSSRLNQNLREDKRWTYGSFSFVLDTSGQRPFLAYASVQTDQTAPALDEMRRELSAIGTDRPPTANEVELFKQKRILALPGRWETSSAVLGALRGLVRFGLPADYWQTYGDRIGSLTTESVAQTAAANMRPEQTVWVVVGDRSVIEESLGELGFDRIMPIDVDGNPL